MKGLLILALISSAFASQDLCKDALTPAGSTFKFADDPASCAGYLYCHYVGDVLQQVVQGTCPPGFNFNGASASCENEVAFPCTAACEFNPAGTAIKIGVDGDTTCRQFKTCDGPTVGATVFSCGETSVFNRNYGVCTRASIAPCPGSGGSGGGGTQCEVGKDGYFNDESGCDKYIFCDGGVQTNDACPPGYHFNPIDLVCDDPEKLDPICEEPVVANIPFGPEIPKPPVVNRIGRRF
ncbi:probable chitinase 10 [Chironomus tepperi]|uniref:probable chitinase 10 n=1 Tax=Chironomus tepperi TaxID=113505 RepID=UPI00391F61B5